MDSERFGAEDSVPVAVAVVASEPEAPLATPAETNVAAQSGSTASLPLLTRSAPEEPTIIIVDGSSSSAKTGLLNKLRDLLPAPCLLISTKTFTDLLPETVRNGTANGNEQAEWVSRCRVGMCGSLQALASSGNHLLVDFDWGSDVTLLRSLCVALKSFQHPLFINAGSGTHSVESQRDASLDSNFELAQQAATPNQMLPVVYDFDLGSLVGMDEETKMNVLDAVVLAHLESRRMPATIHSPIRRCATDSNAAAEEEGGEIARQTAIVATLERLDASVDQAAGSSS
jgi:hypothetical protein